MKNINNILAISILVLGVQIAQADVTSVDHSHRGLLFQTISASDRLNFIDENRNNMELMSTEERQTFIDNMNSGQGMGQGMGMDHSMGQGMGMDRGMGQGMGMNRGMGGGRR